MSTHLIIPGMAKAATTFLHHALGGQDGWCATREKEIGFFREPSASVTRSDYLGHFDQPDASILLDADPQYLTAHTSVFKRVERILGRDVRYLFCLRDPVQRAFSHYLHDLKSRQAIFRNQRLGRDMSGSFWAEDNMAAYLTGFSTSIQAALNSTDQVPLSFVYEEDMVQLDSFAARLGAWLDCPVPRLSAGTRHNPGGWMPRYAYHPNRETEIYQDGVHYRLPARALLLFNNADSRVWFDVPEDRGAMALVSAASWTAALSAEDNERLFEQFFAEDQARIEDLLCVDLGRVRQSGPITARAARACEEILAQLDRVTVDTHLPAEVLKANQLRRDVSDSSDVEAADKRVMLETWFSASEGAAPQSPELLYQLARYLETESELDRALDILRTAWDRDPTDTRIASRLVRLALKMGHALPALKVAKIWVRLEPDAEVSWTLLTRAAHALNRTALALDAAREAKQRGSEHPLVVRLLKDSAPDP